MITFPCKCGNLFNLPDDQAGGLVQCERCGLLADVPTMDDLANLNPDGTFAFDEVPPVDDGIGVAELHRAFSTRTTDEQGREKDLRPTADHFERIGAIQEQTPVRVTPRYDPFTGELIRPLQLKDEEPTPVLAIAAPASLDDPLTPIPVPSLNYAVGEARQTMTFKSIGTALFQPANMIVMFFVLVFYIAAYLAKIPLNMFMKNFHLPMALAMAPNVFLWIIAAHYGCVIEDTGPDAFDELPRPLRFVEFGDDLFRPLLRFMLAMTICFLPAFVAANALNLSANPAPAIVLGLFAFGSFLFPAVLLTSLTGATVLNLSPMRVFGVIGICGGEYLLAVAVGFISLALTIGMLLGPSTFPELVNFPGIQLGNRMLILLPAILLAIYLSHFFAWHLGLLYREHHDQFPWLAQRHVRTPRNKSEEFTRSEGR